MRRTVDRVAPIRFPAMPLGPATRRVGASRRAPDLAAVILVLAGCLIVARVARHATFAGDDWTFVLERRGWGLDVFLGPHGEHLSALPVLAYKLLLEVFGAGSYTPFLALALLVHGIACLLLYVLARRRVGPWAALAPSAVLVLLGPAWQDLLWAFQVGYLGSVASGLGSVLCLERRDRRGDLAAAALLVVSLVCSSIGLAMVVLAAVLLTLDEPRRWRRLWVVGAPLLLYAIWYAGYGTSGIRSENAGRIPSYLAHAFSAATASVTGLAQTDRSPYVVGTTYGRFIALALVALLVLHLVRGGRPPALTWAATAAAFALWTAQCLASFPNGREAEQSRYQYAAAALLLLAVASAASGRRPTLRSGGILAAVTAFAVVANTAMLRERSAFWTGNSFHVAAETGVIEVARDVVAPDFVPEDVFTAAVIGVHNLPVSAGPYLSAVDAFGSPADSPEEILRRPEDVREAADVVLAHAERLRLQPAGAARCRSAAAGREVPVGAGTLTAGTGPGPSAELQLRRFADRSRHVRFTVRGGTTVRLQLPRDRSNIPWQARLVGGQRPRLCVAGPP